MSLAEIMTVSLIYFYFSKAGFQALTFDDANVFFKTKELQCKDMKQR